MKLLIILHIHYIVSRIRPSALLSFRNNFWNCEAL